MLALVLSVAVALMPHHASHHAAQRHAANFPTRGIFIADTSLAGIKLGFTQAQVRAHWGNRFNPCDPGMCKWKTWLYQYSTGEGLGAAVVFDNKGKVTAVWTLGSPDGWKTDKGLKMGDAISQVYQYYNTKITTKCLGFDAISMRNPKTKVVTSFYASSGYVYGFALTSPTQPICQ